MSLNHEVLCIVRGKLTALTTMRQETELVGKLTLLLVPTVIWTRTRGNSSLPTTSMLCCNGGFRARQVSHTTLNFVAFAEKKYQTFSLGSCRD
jgi:hypothetical protein